MFQCYLDDSGTSGLPVVTMVGFVSKMANWEALEPALDKILNRYQVPVLHTKEFYATKDAFKGWPKIKKRTFANELFGAAHGGIYGVSVTMRKASLETHKRRNKGEFASTSAIGMCFSAIMYRVVTDPNIGKWVREDGVAFLVESGNANNAEIEQLFHATANMPAFQGCLRSISFIAKDSCRAIQLADFFAFFSRRHMRDHDRFDGKVVLPISVYLNIIKKHVPIWQVGMRAEPEIVAKLNEIPDLDSLLAKMADNGGHVD